MKQQSKIVRNIKVRMFEKGLNQQRLAARTKISETTLSTKLNNPDTFKVSDLKRIAAVLCCRVSDLIEGE